MQLLIVDIFIVLINNPTSNSELSDVVADVCRASHFSMNTKCIFVAVLHCSDINSLDDPFRHICVGLSALLLWYMMLACFILFV